MAGSSGATAAAGAVRRIAHAGSLQAFRDVSRGDRMFFVPILTREALEISLLECGHCIYHTAQQKDFVSRCQPFMLCAVVGAHVSVLTRASFAFLRHH
jgi:hypothetical protein